MSLLFGNEKPIKFHHGFFLSFPHTAICLSALTRIFPEKIMFFNKYNIYVASVSGKKVQQLKTPRRQILPTSIFRERGRQGQWW